MTLRVPRALHGYTWLVAFLLVAAALRVPDVWRPLDGTTWEPWREADVAAIARNFEREGMNILYPKIDWRGDGPGFVEAEFPLYPWSVAVLYRMFGQREELARVLSFMLLLASCGVFFQLARSLLRPAGAAVALAFFALNPLHVRLSSAIQPEPLMFLCYLVAVQAFLRFLDDEAGRRYYWLSLGATVLAVLAKLPALHVGFLMAALALDRHGIGAVKRWDMWLFALISLLVPAVWYAHAHSLWLTYGNSLGMSDEAYARILTGGLFRAWPVTLPGVVRIEVSAVWTVPGAFVGLLGVWGARRSWTARFVAYWLGSLAAFYLLTSSTTGFEWATYYHIVSLPAAALAIGLGAEWALDTASRVTPPARRVMSVTLSATACLTLLGLLVVSGTAGRRRLLLLALGFFVAWALTSVFAPASGIQSTHGVAVPEGKVDNEHRVHSQLFRALAAGLGFLCVGMCLVLSADRVRLQMHPANHMKLYECTQSFRRPLGEGLIAVTGGANTDLHGLLVSAHHAPYFFYWLDRKGFALADSELSLDHLEELRRRGSRYFIAEGARLATRPEFVARLHATYQLLGACDGAELFHLTPRLPDEERLTPHREPAAK
jgi:4-amino-4-deoxy-L-arabinose transferase-like glycosyltransferase